MRAGNILWHWWQCESCCHLACAALTSCRSSWQLCHSSPRVTGEIFFGFFLLTQWQVKWSAQCSNGSHLNHNEFYFPCSFGLAHFSCSSTVIDEHVTNSQVQFVLEKNVLTHFLPSKLCTTYSYAQVKFKKNEWCHKKNHKKIICTPILILFSGNVVCCLLVSLTIACLPDFWLKGFVCYLFKNYYLKYFATTS
jgi:hypothetical protein